MSEVAVLNSTQEMSVAMEALLIDGDLSRLTADQRVQYYKKTCDSLGLNYLTQPFAYIKLNGKLQFYTRKEATEQLRSIHGVSIYKLEKETFDSVFIVTAYGRTKDGKEDVSTGAVTIAGLKGEALANAHMKSECVPLDSEILTKEGWKTYNNLRIGELVAAYDIDNDHCIWTPLLEVNIFNDVLTVNFGTKLHSFRCTPNHKWAIKNQPYRIRSKGNRKIRGAYKNRQPLFQLIEADQINSGQKIILSASMIDEPQIQISDNEAAIIGWIMCDGTVQRRGTHLRAGISQSKIETVQEIRTLLTGSGKKYYEVVGKPTTRTFPSGKTFDCLPQHWFYLSAFDSKDLFNKCQIESDADLPNFVLNISNSARKSMLNAMMHADGDKKGRFGKKRKPGVMKAFQLLATLTGHSLGKFHVGNIINTQKLRKQRYIAGSNLKMGDPFIENVWCPTTAYGTWIMRQNNSITITGNTKAKRRLTLSLCGLGYLDETEVSSIPNAPLVNVNHETGEIVEEKINLPPPLGIPRAQLAEAIGTATTLTQLKDAYANAYRAHTGNLEAMKDLTELKDKRRDWLQNEKFHIEIYDPIGMPSQEGIVA